MCEGSAHRGGGLALQKTPYTHFRKRPFQSQQGRRGDLVWTSSLVRTRFHPTAEGRETEEAEASLSYGAARHKQPPASPPVLRALAVSC